MTMEEADLREQLRQQMKSKDNTSKRKLSDRDEGRREDASLRHNEKTDHTVSKDQESGVNSKRRRRLEGGPGARRMFGALMGHLGKARTAIEKDTAILEKRNSVVLEARKKEAEESKRIHDLDTKAALTKRNRITKESKKDRLKRKIKDLKTEFETWISKERSCAKYIKTVSFPTLHYLPAKHSKNTQAMIDAGLESLEVKISARQRELDTSLDKLQEELEELEAQPITTTNNNNNMEVDKEEDDGESSKSSRENNSEHGSDDDDDNKEEEESTDKKDDAVKDEEQQSSEKELAEESVESSSDKEETNEAEKTTPRVSRRNRKEEECDAIAESSETPLVTPSKMLVVQLKKELKKRGLDTKGRKAELVLRLEQHLKN